MSIEKKSLISTLKTTKKANMAKDEISESPATASPTTKSPTMRLTAKKLNTARKMAIKQ